MVLYAALNTGTLAGGRNAAASARKRPKPHEVSAARPRIIPTIRKTVITDEAMPICRLLAALIAVVPIGAITSPKPRPLMIVLTVICVQPTLSGHRCINQKPIAVGIKPNTAVKRHEIIEHNQPPSNAPIGIIAVRRKRARPLSIAGRPSTVAINIGISAIAMISAAPTSRLTNAVAEKLSRLKSESSTTGQTLVIA